MTGWPCSRRALPRLEPYVPKGPSTVPRGEGGRKAILLPDYKTLNGARLGDLFMSLIHTCRLCGGNPLDYLNAVVRHAKEAGDHPTRWFPWNYKQALPAAETG